MPKPQPISIGSFQTDMVEEEEWPPAATRPPRLADELLVLFEDVRVLKRSARDFTQQAAEIEKLRGEIDDMKSHLGRFAIRRAEEMNSWSVPMRPCSNECSEEIDGVSIMPTDQIALPKTMPTDQIALPKTQELAPKRDKSKWSEIRQLEEVPSEHLSRDLDGATGEFVFSGSIWDASLLMGVEPMGTAAALQLLLILLVNLSVQVVYTVLVQQQLTFIKYSGDRITGFRNFRSRTAHDFKYQDSITWESLAARVCKSDDSLSMASSQSDALQEIRTYLPQGDTIFGELTGQAMCTLALMVWCLTATKEIRATCMAFLAVGKRSVEGEKSRDTKIKLSGEKWVFVSFSRCRLLIISVVLLIRLLIACCLLYSGMKWLVYTINLENLILNAVALECILQLDELLFEALAPQRVMVLCDQFEPLPLPKLDRGGLDLPTIFGFVFVVALVCVFGFIDMFDNVDQLRKAEAELCHGDLNFVYSQTPAVPFFQWARTPSSIGKINGVAEDLVQRLARRDGASHQILKETLSIESKTTSWSLEATAKWSLEKWTSYFNPMCQDLFNRNQLSGSISYENYQKVLTIWFPSDPPVTSCANLTAHCDRDTTQAIIARRVCPQSCGCDNPFSHLVLGTTANGCPNQCFRSRLYEGVRNTTRCVDTNWTTLETMPFWRYYANQGLTLARGDNNTGHGWSNTIRRAWKMINVAMLGGFNATGCPALALLRRTYGIDLCRTGFHKSEIRIEDNNRPLSLLCPQSCDCTSGLANCPNSCPTR